MGEDDFSYFRQRAVEEREKAAAARDPTIAEIHFALASKYDELTEKARPPEQSAVDRPRATELAELR